MADDAGGWNWKNAVGHGCYRSRLLVFWLCASSLCDGSFGLYERTGASAALWETDSGMVQQDDKKSTERDRESISFL